MRRTRYQGRDCIGACERAAYAGWYQGNLALTRYADRQLWIWALSFPVAMTFAIFLGLGLDWLPNIQRSQLPAGLLMLYLSSGVAAIFMIAAAGLFWTLAPLPAAVAYAWLLARTQTVLTGGRKSTGKIFRPLLISILVGGVLGGIVHLILPTLSWFSGVEVAWAVVFGASFTRRGIAA